MGRDAGPANEAVRPAVAAYNQLRFNRWIARLAHSMGLGPFAVLSHDEGARVQLDEEGPELHGIPRGVLNDAVPGRVIEAGCSAGCTAVVVVLRPAMPALLSVTLVLAAAVLAMDLARREHRDPTDVRPIALVICALFVVAVAVPPRFPSDIRSYAADGRLVAHYHDNPYAVSPGRHSGDPAFSRVRDATAPYGPLFIGATAFVSFVSRSHVSWQRWWYQGSAALAIAAALLLLWRTRRSSAAVVFLGLHPAVAGTVVNGGHNDALIGLAVLSAVIAAERQRFGVSGSIVAAAMLIKVTAGLALVPIAMWAATRYGGPALRRFLAPVAIVVIPSVLAIPGLFTSIRASNFALVTRTSVWSMYPFRGPLLPRFGDGAVTQLSLVCVSVAVVLIARDRTRDLRDRVTGAVAAWLVLSAYVMPWYTVWALPVAAYDHRRPFARVVAAQGAVVASAFLVPSTLLANRFVSFAFGWIASVGLLAAFVYAARTGRRDVPDRDSPAPVVGDHSG